MTDIKLISDLENMEASARTNDAAFESGHEIGASFVTRGVLTDRDQLIPQLGSLVEGLAMADPVGEVANHAVNPAFSLGVVAGAAAELLQIQVGGPAHV